MIDSSSKNSAWPHMFMLLRSTMYVLHRSVGRLSGKHGRDIPALTMIQSHKMLQCCRWGTILASVWNVRKPEEDKSAHNKLFLVPGLLPARLQLEANPLMVKTPFNISLLCQDTIMFIQLLIEWISRHSLVFPTERHARREVGSTDSREALSPPGFASV